MQFYDQARCVNVTYELIGFISFFNFHYIYFRKLKNSNYWRVFNDSKISDIFNPNPK